MLFVFRIEKGISDIVFLAHIVGIVGEVLWKTKINQSDMVGFMTISSQIAIIFSVFFFFLFGVIHGFISITPFWRSLIVFNYGIALILLAISRNDNYALLLFSFIIGVVMARLMLTPIEKNPRLAIVCAIVISILLYMLLFRLFPYNWTDIAATAVYGGLCFLGGVFVSLKIWSLQNINNNKK